MSSDGKPGIPTGLADPIVEYLANLGIPLEDVKELSVEGFSLAYKAVHDKGYRECDGGKETHVVKCGRDLWTVIRAASGSGKEYRN